MNPIIKRVLIAVIAILSLGCSLVVLFMNVRSLLLGGMRLHGARDVSIYVTSLAMFCWLAWLGIRGLRIAMGLLPITGPRLKMWRVFVGTLFLLSAVRSVVDPKSNRYQADNLAQANGMYAGLVIVAGCGIWLIFSAFPKWQRRSEAPRDLRSNVTSSAGGC